MPPYTPKIIDLFAGVGGLSLGAARAGFDLSLAVEKDKHALAAHIRNFPGNKHSENDISELNGENLLNQAGLDRGELDGLIGGPPCQGFSTMGQRNVVDPRNDLFVKFFELVAECRPKFFVAENVLGILDEQYAEIREAARAHVDGEYTVLEPIRLKASDFGAPTIRERAFFIGYRADAMEALDSQMFEAHKVAEITTVETALRGLPIDIDSAWQKEEHSWKAVHNLPTSRFYERVAGHRPAGIGDEEAIRRHEHERLVSGCFGTRHSCEVQARYEGLNPGQKDQISKAVRLRADGLCPTLRAGTGSDRGSYQAVRPIHPTRPRVITPREAARLQGFPDWFRFAPSKWHSFRQIGNSVSPLVSEAIFSVLRSRIEKNSA